MPELSLSHVLIGHWSRTLGLLGLLVLSQLQAHGTAAVSDSSVSQERSGVMPGVPELGGARALTVGAVHVLGPGDRVAGWKQVLTLAVDVVDNGVRRGLHPVVLTESRTNSQQDSDIC